jgi:hypothetical protein
MNVRGARLQNGVKDYILVLSTMSPHQPFVVKMIFAGLLAATYMSIQITGI